MSRYFLSRVDRTRLVPMKSQIEVKCRLLAHTVNLIRTTTLTPAIVALRLCCAYVTRFIVVRLFVSFSSSVCVTETLPR